MKREQLFPREPRRMKQPTKDALREHLALAATEIERLGTVTDSMVESVGSALYVYWAEVNADCRERYRDKVWQALTEALRTR